MIRLIQHLFRQLQRFWLRFKEWTSHNHRLNCLFFKNRENSEPSTRSTTSPRSTTIQTVVNGQGNVAIGSVQDGSKAIGIVGRDAYVDSNIYVFPPRPQPVGIPQNIPRSGVKQFVGRDEDLKRLHDHLQRSDRLAITVIAGMGGIGKTELALQYALRYYKQIYLGGVCWVQARGLNVGTQITTFAQRKLNLDLPIGMDLADQVDFCWSHWPEGNVLVVLDDVVDYAEVAPYLPPVEPRFNVLITTRLQLGQSFKQVLLDSLDESAAVNLLQSLVGENRVQQEREHAEALCNWLGYLPLGLELVGRYIVQDPDLSLSEMQQQLQAKRIAQPALQKPEHGMTAKLGVRAAFELSWDALSDEAKELSCLLSLFALAPIPWNLVEQTVSNQAPDELKEVRLKLSNLNLLNRKAEKAYQLHQLIREFMRDKLSQLSQNSSLKYSFVSTMLALAKKVPKTLNRNTVVSLSPYIPHIAEAASTLINFFGDDDIKWPFEGLGRFYASQGLYEKAEFWYKRHCEILYSRLGLNHPDAPSCLANLALVFYRRGLYRDAQPLYEQALELGRNLFGEISLDVATILNNFALLYQARGFYWRAEQLFKQAQNIRENLLENHPDIAEIWHNLGSLYLYQEKFGDAEKYLKRSLTLKEELMACRNSDITSLQVAESLNNLAEVYRAQDLYSKAEGLHLQALNIRREMLGEEHPSTAQSLNNLAVIYAYQGDYCQAEVLMVQALNILENYLGSNHPDTISTHESLTHIRNDMNFK